MDRIAELLARLGSTENPLTDEERTELRDLIGEEYARLDALDPSPQVVADQASVVEAAEKLHEDDARIEQEMADAETQREETRKRFRVVNGEDDGEDDGDAGTETGEEDEGEGEEGDGKTAAPSATGTQQTPAKAAASSRKRASLSAISKAGGGSGDGSPEAQIPDKNDGTKLTTVLVASADVQGFGVGQELADWNEVGKAFNAKLHAVQRVPLRRKGSKSHGTELVMVASAKWEYPEERTLREGMDAENRRKLEDAVSIPALVASGGTCSPVTVDYDVPVWAVADRPLRDSFPSFGATRGGLTFTPPPVITDLAGATTIWTEANDASPSSPATKPVLKIACGSPTTVYVDAIPTRVEVGNFQGRFAPEWTGAQLQLAVAAAARIAETNLLTKMLAASTVVTTGKLLGATRDILALLDQAIMSYRYEQRIPDSVRLHAWFPQWFRNMVRADIAREFAHDIDDTNPFAITDEQINSWFSVRGVNVTWFIDYLGTASKSGVTIPNQYPAAIAAGSALPDWPSKSSNAGMLWFLAAEGTFQFLDGGELDLGIVRDSILDSTNDYETFVETFEGLAFRGIRALAMVSYVRPSGGSAAGVDTTSY